MDPSIEDTGRACTLFHSSDFACMGIFHGRVETNVKTNTVRSENKNENNLRTRQAIFADGIEDTSILRKVVKQ